MPVVFVFVYGPREKKLEVGNGEKQAHFDTHLRLGVEPTQQVPLLGHLFPVIYVSVLFGDFILYSKIGLF